MVLNREEMDTFLNWRISVAGEEDCVCEATVALDASIFDEEETPPQVDWCQFGPEGLKDWRFNDEKVDVHVTRKW
jgi:hypothetical protein